MVCPTSSPSLPEQNVSSWSFCAEGDEALGVRLDVAVGAQAKQRGVELSRARIGRLIETGDIQVDASSSKPSQRLRFGQTIRVSVPAAAPMAHVTPTAMALDVLFEDQHILVLNKAAHLPVHPGAGVERQTLVHALLARQSVWSGIGGVQRPGIVHRLDADTTGALVVAKHDGSHRHLAKQFAERAVRKQYLALCFGHLPPDAQPQGTIETYFGRHPSHRQRFTGRLTGGPRRARTSYRVLETHEGRTLMELRLWTGRTHQARVHLMELGLPVCGDALYANARALARARSLGISHHALHAWKLSFRHPSTNEPMSFVAPLPATWSKCSPLARSLGVCESAPL